jgi:hypothetical protein
LVDAVSRAREAPVEAVVAGVFDVASCDDDDDDVPLALAVSPETAADVRWLEARPTVAAAEAGGKGTPAPSVQELMWPVVLLSFDMARD